MTSDYAKSLKDPQVHQKARVVSREIFHIAKTFPKEEMYSLTDRFRHAALPAGAQITEAWGRRRLEKHFVSKLTDADAGQMETRDWVGEALDCGRVSPVDAERPNSGLDEIARMLNTTDD